MKTFRNILMYYLSIFDVVGHQIASQLSNGTVTETIHRLIDTNTVFRELF